MPKKKLWPSQKLVSMISSESEEEVTNGVYALLLQFFQSQGKLMAVTLEFAQKQDLVENMVKLLQNLVKIKSSKLRNSILLLVGNILSVSEEAAYLLSLAPLGFYTSLLDLVTEKQLSDRYFSYFTFNLFYAREIELFQVEGVQTKLIKTLLKILGRLEGANFEMILKLLGFLVSSTEIRVVDQEIFRLVGRFEKFCQIKEGKCLSEKYTFLLKLLSSAEEEIDNLLFNFGGLELIQYLIKQREGKVLDELLEFFEILGERHPSTLEVSF